MKKTFLACAAALLLPVTAHAASVDLTGWEEDGFHNSPSAGTWTVQPGNDSVIQSANGNPTVFFESGSNSQGTALSGTIEVQTTGDDDFVGFVLGYQDGEMNSASADFWLIDWKQIDQNHLGFAPRGLALSHVSGDVAAAGAGNFWAHTGTVTEAERAANLGSTGWADNTEYTFELTFTASLIEVKVNGVTEISFTAAENGGNLFTDGSFGFYNYSQNAVRYAGITEEAVVPLPASLPLLLAGFGALGLIRRRRKS